MVEWNIGRKRFDVYVHKRVSPESALPCKTSAMRWSPRCVDEVRVLYPWTWPVLEMFRPSPPNGGRWLTSCNSQTTIDQPHGKLNERCSLVLMSEAIISEKCCSLPGGYFDNRNFFFNLPLAFGFKISCSSERVAVPVSLALIDEPVVHLLQFQPRLLDQALFLIFLSCSKQTHSWRETCSKHAAIKVGLNHILGNDKYNMQELC